MEEFISNNNSVLYLFVIVFFYQLYIFIQKNRLLKSISKLEEEKMRLNQEHIRLAHGLELIAHMPIGGDMVHSDVNAALNEVVYIAQNTLRE